MKSRFAVSILVVISFFLLSTFFSACEKKSEPTANASAEAEKKIEAIGKFEKMGDKSSPDKSLELIDEASNSLPEIVASVNDVKITNEPVKSALQKLKAQASRQNQVLNKEQIKQMINQILEVEIQREVLFQKGKELNIEVLDEDVAKIVDAMKSRHKNKEKFSNEFSKRDLSIEMLKKQISRKIIVSRLIQNEIQHKVKISDQ